MSIIMDITEQIEISTANSTLHKIYNFVKKNVYKISLNCRQ